MSYVLRLDKIHACSVILFNFVSSTVIQIDKQYQLYSHRNYNHFDMESTIFKRFTYSFYSSKDK